MKCDVIGASIIDTQSARKRRVNAGLFQQAIVQSGSPFSYWAAHEQHDRLSSYFSQLTASMGCSPGGNEHGGGEGSFGRAENGGGGDSGGWGGGDIGAAVDDVEQCLRRLDWQIFADFEDSDVSLLCQHR